MGIATSLAAESAAHQWFCQYIGETKSAMKQRKQTSDSAVWPAIVGVEGIFLATRKREKGIVHSIQSTI